MTGASIVRIEYAPITQYDEIKDSVASVSKDKLIRALLTSSFMHDIKGKNCLISDEHAFVVSQWSNLYQYTGKTDERLEQFLLKYFPDASGQISAEELFLLYDISKASANIIKAGIRSVSSPLEIWVITKNDNFDAFEKACDLAYVYEIKNRKPIRCISITNEQADQIPDLTFLISF